jgi:hypothetical protein
VESGAPDDCAHTFGCQVERDETGRCHVWPRSHGDRVHLGGPGIDPVPLDEGVDVLVELGGEAVGESNVVGEPVVGGEDAVGHVA